MDNTVITALVAAVSAVVGGVITGVVAPVVKHRLEVAVAEKSRKREQIAKWRKMVIEVDGTANGDASPGETLQLHPEYITLEPFLTDAARTVAYQENRTLVVGQALSLPLETLKDEIARIEKMWRLHE
ncbi:hypothetical protein [Cupriavidus sp. L7L]|uniref:hypothetical protein n=1 Tax=Cupriavidus sp. L7L TaxID=2546443 RepID=UPI001055290D|nr:hypothetical protein [Cupriavidus sp. L7L]TDF60132.1 hypothetical protein E1J61_33985 [Cupriavidus sp. L7L]